MKDSLPATPTGLPADRRHEVANLIHSAAVRLLRRVRTADAEMDLDGPRAALLSVLVFGGPRPISQLAETEQVTPPAVTKMVSSLQAEGLVTRERDHADRRVVWVAATDSGRQVLERGRAARVRALADLLDGATAQELNTLADAAQIVAERLRHQQLSEQAPAPPR